MIVFYNPHVDDFLAEPPHYRFLGRRPLRKYGYLLQGMLESGENVGVLVDGTVSAFVPERVLVFLPRWLRKAIALVESRWWVRLNGLQGRARFFNTQDIEPHNILFAFSYKGATGLFSERRKLLQKLENVVFHLSHYFVSTGEKADNLRTLDNIWLAGDSDITENRYFKQYFSWYRRPFLVLPFAVAPRFNVRVDFEDRQAKCIATGTFHDLKHEVPAEKYADYMNFFGQSTYHPVRKLIHDNSQRLETVIDSKISLYRGATAGSGFKRYLQHLVVAQKEYFAIDIVELYNGYRYAIVGEEASGFPALGAFECMACGCVLIAQPEYYEGWGLRADEHFVAHDGSLESIIRTIEHLNTNLEEARRIAAAGAAFVDERARLNPAYRWATRTIAGVVGIA